MPLVLDPRRGVLMLVHRRGVEGLHPLAHRQVVDTPGSSSVGPSPGKVHLRERPHVGHPPLPVAVRDAPLLEPLVARVLGLELHLVHVLAALLPMLHALRRISRVCLLCLRLPGLHAVLEALDPLGAQELDVVQQPVGIVCLGLRDGNLVFDDPLPVSVHALQLLGLARDLRVYQILAALGDAHDLLPIAGGQFHQALQVLVAIFASPLHDVGVQICILGGQIHHDVRRLVRIHLPMRLATGGPAVAVRVWRARECLRSLVDSVHSQHAPELLQVGVARGILVGRHGTTPVATKARHIGLQHVRLLADDQISLTSHDLDGVLPKGLEKVVPQDD
mmetsp:Transcript_78550/g.199871  ORF Transcript_78550/g.199871 Transcript_78550/m.199871 type:complete len:334 (-) Transcript_78550:320-1321(-)